tara:strand:+ start:452 stop:1258 length:807 start_codon:yes stop_codon:yes gene_type:complete
LTGLIKNTFSQLKSANQKAMIPFITAHFPNRDIFNSFLHQCPEAGASIIEIGIPFSDPMADGVVIQRSSEIAIKNGFNFKDLFEDIAHFKSKFPNTPIVLMTYLNPLVHYKMPLFLHDAKQAGVDGLLIVDLPPENYDRILPDNHDLDIIRLVTPTTDLRRLEMINSSASGFIYYVSVKGVTGSKRPNELEIKAHLQQIQSQISLPMVIGFGINSTSDAAQMAALSNGIVIGSRLIKPFLDSSHNKYKDIVDQQIQFLNQIRLSINVN